MDASWNANDLQTARPLRQGHPGGGVRAGGVRAADESLAPLSMPGARISAYVVGAAVLVICGAVLSPVLSAGFLSRDDGEYVRQAARLSGLKWADIGSAFQVYSRPSESAGLYQPAALLSLALDARLTTDPGAPAFQFHLTSLALHVVNVGLVYLLALRLLGGGVGRDRRQTANGKNVVTSKSQDVEMGARSLRSFGAKRQTEGCIAGCARGGIARVLWAGLLALLFGLHPVQVEAVAWISQRGMVLGTFFALIALHAYVRHLVSSHRWWLVAATVGYVGAVLSMPVFIGLPVLMLILDLWPGRREGWRPFVEKLPMFVVLLAAGVVLFAVGRHIPPRPADDVGSLTLMVGSMAGFVERLVWPVQLAPFYPLGSEGMSVGRMLWSMAVPILLIGAAVWSFRRSRPMFLAVCGTMLLFCPALRNVAYGSELLGDRYLYAALIAPLMAAAAWLGLGGLTLARPAGRMCAIGCAAVVCVLGVHSYAQTFVWQSSRDLYEYTIARYPTWPKGHTGLVEAYLQENEYDAALYHAERAARIAPDDPTTQFYLGTTLLLHHGSRSAEAIAPLEKALRSNPSWIACLQNLGVALARSGQMERAIPYMETARDLEPESASIRIGLGHAYLRVERPASARRELQAALRHQNHPAIHFGLAMAWAANEAPDQARRHLAAALAKDPKLAGRIAATPELQALGIDLDFDGLPDVPLYDLSDPATMGVELPAARNARGT